MEWKNSGEWNWIRLTTTTWYTILIDQVNNLLHYRVLLVVSERDLGDKTPDLHVNLALGASLDVGVVLHGRLNVHR